MKIYTKRGDQGETDLFGGERTSKDAPRVSAYGDVDELNAFVGAAAAVAQPELADLLSRIQNSLFDLGSLLATPDPAHRVKANLPPVDETAVSELESAIDLYEQELEPLKTFVLPGGTPAAAAFHIARTVCRRAERAAVRLARSEDVDAGSIRYLNRLSDLFFVLARLENHRAAVPDVAWVPRDR